MVRLGCSPVPYEVEELARGVDEVAEAGYGGIELSNDQVDGLDNAGLAAVAGAAASAGLAVATAGVGFLGLDNKVSNWLEKAVALGPNG